MVHLFDEIFVHRQVHISHGQGWRLTIIVEQINIVDQFFGNGVGYQKLFGKRDNPPHRLGGKHQLMHLPGKNEINRTILHLIFHKVDKMSTFTLFKEKYGVIVVAVRFIGCLAIVAFGILQPDERKTGTIFRFFGKCIGFYFFVQLVHSCKNNK